MTHAPPDAARPATGARRSPRTRLGSAGAAALITVATAAACSTSGSSGAASPPSRHDIAAMLSRYGHDVRTGDRHAALKALAPGAFRTRQQTALANVAKLPLTTWSYSLGPPVRAADAQRAARAKYGSSAVIARVTVHYALRGVDREATSHDLWWTFVRRDGRVRAVADDDLATQGGTSWRGPWDFGPIAVVHSARGIVIGPAGDDAMLHTVADTVAAAVPAVSAVWGTTWSQQVAAIVPTSDTELHALLPDGTNTSDVAALATSDGEDPVSATVTGQRLIVPAGPFAKLSATGRAITFRHEVTHLATAAQTTAHTPRWLVEGFAEYVGNLHSGQPVRVAAAELARDVRAGKVPRGLPADTAFDADTGRAQAYQQAWLACRLIAARAGADGPARFYRSVAATVGTPDEATVAALRAVVHETPTQFLAQYRAYVRDELGS